MAGKFEKLYQEARAEVTALKRIREDAARYEFLNAALCVINRHNLTQEFVDEISKPSETK